MYYPFEDKYNTLKYKLRVASLLNKDLVVTQCGGAIIVTKTLLKGTREALIAFIADNGRRTTISTRAESVHVRMDPDVVINFANDVKRIAHLVRAGVNITRIKDNGSYFRKLCEAKLEHTEVRLSPGAIMLVPTRKCGKNGIITITAAGLLSVPNPSLLLYKDELNKIAGLLLERKVDIN